MRDFSKIDGYITKLYSDIYPQPPDNGHTAWANESIAATLPLMDNIENVLDVGCGEGFCQEIFESHGLRYQGVAFGEDVINAQAMGLNVVEMDFSFLNYPDRSFDVVYSRHSLEHSPMPLLTLMEWHRVTKRYLALVLPVSEYWGIQGKNHYFMLSRSQWENLFNIAGFKIIYTGDKFQPMGQENVENSHLEFWYLLEKQ